MKPDRAPSAPAGHRTLALVTQALLVTISFHALAALVLIDFGFTPFLE